MYVLFHLQELAVSIESDVDRVLYTRVQLDLSEDVRLKVKGIIWIYWNTL